jgi:hypothetical protein
MTARSVPIQDHLLRLVILGNVGFIGRIQMKPFLKGLSICALLALGGAASAQNIGPRGSGDDLVPQERRERRPNVDRPERADQGDRVDRQERRDRGQRDGPRERFEQEGPRQRFEREERRERVERRERFDEGRRDRADTRIIVRPSPNVRFGTIVRREPDVRFVIRPTRVVCRVIQERRFNPRTGVVRIRPVRECSRFVSRRRVIVSRRVIG